MFVCESVFSLPSIIPINQFSQNGDILLQKVPKPRLACGTQPQMSCRRCVFLSLPQSLFFSLFLTHSLCLARSCPLSLFVSLSLSLSLSLTDSLTDSLFDALFFPLSLSLSFFLSLAFSLCLSLSCSLSL